MKPFLRLSGYTLLCLVGACSDPPAVSDFVVDDSSGVVISVSARSAWSSGDAAWTLEAEPAVEIKGDPDVSEQTLFGVSNAVILSDGRVVIANGGNSQLLAFDSTGSFLAAWGGPGEGPGEFNLSAIRPRSTGLHSMVGPPSS